ncbi:MAG: T9SS type A sorting domain-containing protein, partial [Calditrichaeota bacterium]|nr:T9SS type A sorting domain-containing protein [Calditrichota bacterium]
DTLDTELIIQNQTGSDITFKIDLREVDQQFAAGSIQYLSARGAPPVGPARDRRGEPDRAGYYWIDNAEQDGPRYNWVDIQNRQGVQRLNAGDDWNSGVLELGFEFPWYGEWYSAIRVCSNGWITFDRNQGGTFSDLPEFPNRNAPNNIIAVDCLNLALTNQSSMLFWTDNEGTAIVSWLMMSYQIAPVRPDITMQAILTAETGTVLMQYGNQLGLPANFVNVGYENQDGSLGANILFHNGGVANGLAIVITGPFSKWLIVEPLEGEVAANEDLALDVMFVPGDMEAGSYEMRIGLTARYLNEQNQADSSFVEISALLTVDNPIWEITGAATNAANGEGIEGAKISLDRYLFMRRTNEDGRYVLADLPPGNYTLVIEALDFLPVQRRVELGDNGGQLELNIEMLHATCDPSVDDLYAQLEPDAEIDLDFSVANNGNGPLAYRVERRLLGEANAAPWELRRNYAAGQIFGDDRIEGVAFDGEFFYLAGAAGNNPNTIYVMNREGERVRQFVQPGESNYGMKDLEWDGELLWGSGEQRVFGFDRDGQVQIQFQGPFNPNQAIAFDPVNNLLWVCATTNNIVGFDRQGNALNRILNRRGLRLYGLAYWADDPDRCPLYILHSPAANEFRVLKMNVVTGDTLFVRQLPSGGSPGGAYITNAFDVYSWVFMNIANVSPNAGNDRVDIYQLDARKEWFAVEPAEGVIDAGSEQDFTLHLNSTGLPIVEFEGELVFIHDGVGSLTRIPVTLNVAEGRLPAFRILDFRQGWNLISANVQPDPADVRVVMAPLVQAGQLQLMKNNIGQFYAPRLNFCNIPGWVMPQGYLVKTTAACQLRVEGLSAMPDDPIPLREGWNIAAYYPRQPLDVRVALAGLVDQLIIAKDGVGNFYLPARNFSNMPMLREGQGYQMKVDEDVELVYRLQQNQAAALQPPAVSAYSRSDLPQVTPTGRNMSLLLMENGIWKMENATERASLPAECRIEDDGAILVYAGERLVGSGRMEGGVCGIAVWGDDPTTADVDGAREGEELRIVNCIMNSKFQIPNSKFVYRTDGFEVLELGTSGDVCPTEFGLTEVYPNPFNAAVRVEFSLPEAGMVKVGLFDLSGRLTLDLGAGHWSTGRHRLEMNGSSLVSGIYLLRLEASGKTAQVKVTLVK